MIAGITLTKHAARRMDERNITWPMIAAVIQHGVQVMVEIYGQVSKRLYGLVVVMDGNKVVTVMRDRHSMASPAKHRNDVKRAQREMAARSRRWGKA